MNPLTFAVAAVVTDDAGRVLLCQRSQGRGRWGLPGGRIRSAESPVHAAIRDIRSETGMETDIIELIGIYHLSGGHHPVDQPTGPGRAAPLPDVLVHVFRGRVRASEAIGPAPGRTCRLAWHDPGALPEPVTPTTRTAIADATAGRAGVLRGLRRDPEPHDGDHGPEADVPAELIASG